VRRRDQLNGKVSALKQMFSRSLVIGVPLMLICCASAPDVTTGDPAGRLKPCPSSPNCVSTRAAVPGQQMAPLPYRGDRARSRRLILSIVGAMPRTTIVSQTDAYIHVEFRSRLFGFVDDVEFLFDDEGAVIHFRSASRSGYSDMGVNRKRMEGISEAYQRADPDAATETQAAE
jgi:uncharacterized protein (DUF1499 family)